MYAPGSILAHLASAVGPEGLAPASLVLPGEVAAAPGAIRWAPGAEEHVRRHHVGPQPAEADVAELLGACRALLGGDLEAAEAADRLEAAFATHGRLEAADGWLTALAAEPDDGDWAGLHLTVRVVADRTASAPALKMALALLGRFANPDDRERFRLAAHHPEFSLYASVALASAPDPAAHRELAAILARTSGWARTDVAEALCRFAPDQGEARHALLVEGTRGMDGLDGYVALPIAEALPLESVLADPDLAPNALDGASRLLATLATEALDGGPGGTLDHYAEAGLALDRFLGAAEAATPTADLAIGGLAIARWLRTRRDGPIPATDRLRLRSRAETFLASPALHDAVREALVRPGVDDTAAIARAAATLGVTEALPAVLDRVRAEPEDAATIRAAWALGGADAADALLALRAVLPDPGPPGLRALRTVGPGVSRAFARAAVVSGLGPVATPAARAALRAAFEDPEPDVRAAAIVACLDVAPGPPPPGTAEALVAALDDPAPVVAAAAAGACGTFGLGAASGRLRALAKEHGEELVRQAATRALEALDGAE